MMRHFSIAVMTVSSWLLAICLLTISCADDLDNSHEQIANGRQSITFTVDDLQDWRLEAWSETRSAARLLAGAIPITENGEATSMKLCVSTTLGIGTAFVNQNKTRGVAQTSLYNHFTVVAYGYDASSQWGNVARLYQAQATLATDNQTWEMTGGTHYWEAGKTMRFVGFATATGAGLDSTGVTVAGYPYLDYTVSETVADQEDLMTALSQPSTFSSTAGRVNMPFKHALTAIRFAIGDNLEPGIVINRISLKNIARKGRVTIDDQVQWTNIETLTQFNIIDLNYTVPSSSAGAIIKSSTDTDAERKATLLMIPQQFTESQEAVVEIVYTDSNGAHTVSASLDGQTWLPGTAVTYMLSVNDNSLKYTFSAESAVVVGHNGGTTTFSVTSYSETHDGLNKTARPWSVIGYSIDGGQTFTAEKPKSLNWLGVATTSGEGSTTHETGTLIITAQTASSTEELTSSNAISRQATFLQDAPTHGTQQNYYDLSTHDLMGNETLRNTANCYIVNGQGYYKIPLVYGNAIKNGEVQSAIINRDPYYNYNAYTQATYVSNNKIKTAYLADDGTPNTGILCWQDANNLVSDVALSNADASGLRYLTFKIGGDITPGNAVVAVCDMSGTIMWSWHIWVTPVDILATKETLNYQGFKYDMATQNLGFVTTSGKMKTYDGREVVLKLLQEDSGLTTTFTIKQNRGVEFEGPVTGYCPYYQFGRKDPMLPSNGMSDIDHEQYNATRSWRKAKGPVYTGAAIRNPNVFYGGIASSNPPNANWNTQRFNNLWNVQDSPVFGFSNKKVVKTVYDPCPAGFSIPPSGAFAFMTKTGENVANFTNTSKLNVKGTFQNGWEFYTGIGNETLFFLCTGYRPGESTSDGSHTSFHVYGHCWTGMGAVETVNYGVRARFNAVDVLVWGEVARVNGFGIRPIKEQ